MKLGEGLRQREQEQNEAEIDEITPSVLKQIENMPKDRWSLEKFSYVYIFVYFVSNLWPEKWSPKKANFNSKCFLWALNVIKLLFIVRTVHYSALNLE